MSGGRDLNGQCLHWKPRTPAPTPPQQSFRQRSANDVNTENTIGLGVAEDLDAALSIANGAGARVSGEGEVASVESNVGCLKLLFRLCYW